MEFQLLQKNYKYENIEQLGYRVKDLHQINVSNTANVKEKIHGIRSVSEEMSTTCRDNRRKEIILPRVRIGRIVFTHTALFLKRDPQDMSCI